MSATPLHLALAAVGSHGDVHPFVGLGLRLRERGHRVSVLTNEHFEPLVRNAGLEFISIATDAEYRQIADDPDLWNGRKAFFAIARNIGALIERVYRKLEALHAGLAASPDAARFRRTLAGAVVTRSGGRVVIERAPARRTRGASNRP